MSLKVQIDFLTKEINMLYKQAADVQDLAWKKVQLRETLISQIILEEKLLKDTDWKLEFAGANDAYLAYVGKVAGTNMETILNMACHDWHSRFQMQDDISFHFNDNDISLHFAESKMILPFTQKYGLVINGSGIQDQLAKLKRDAASLELICHQFGL